MQFNQHKYEKLERFFWITFQAILFFRHSFIHSLTKEMRTTNFLESIQGFSHYYIPLHYSPTFCRDIGISRCWPILNLLVCAPWSVIWFEVYTSSFLKSKTKKKRRKVCHLAQLVLPTVYNNPIYTSILHDIYLSYGGVLIWDTLYTP